MPAYRQFTLFDDPDENGPAKDVKPSGQVEPAEPPPSSGPAAALPAEPAAEAPDPGEDAVRSVIAVQPGETVYVVDAYSLIYQVFHALPEMTGPKGQPVGAIHGFVRDMVDLLERQRPTYLVCAFDPPTDTFRHSLYTDYKGQREAMPDDLRPQIANIRRMLEALGILMVEVPGYEADDVLATIASQTAAAGGTCVLVTGDKDCRQLLSERVAILNIRKGEMFQADALEADWGIRPEQVVDYQALVGDSIDSIPGVPLIGPKIARELLQKYESLEGIYSHLSELKAGKRKENLEKHREQAFLSRQLAKLVTDIPLTIDWEGARAGRYSPGILQELCREFGFRSLAERLGQLAAAPQVLRAAGEYQLLRTADELRAWKERVGRPAWLSLKLVATAQHPRWCVPLGLALSTQPGEAGYLPIQRPGVSEGWDTAALLGELRDWFEDPSVAKAGHNLKHDRIALRVLGVDLAGVSFDTMVADYLLAPGERSHGLADLASRYLHHKCVTLDAFASGKRGSRLEEWPAEQILEFAGQEADLPLRLRELLTSRLRGDDLESLFQQLEMPLVEVLADLEFNGIRIDVDRLKQLSEQYGTRLATLEQEIYALAGGPFNIDSPSQLGKVLFERLGLPVVKKTKTGFSTDAEVLAQLAERHPLPAKILEYRQFSKLKGTYVDALPELVHPLTKRVHTSFKQDVAATGRLSSMDPNLQNIPVRSDSGREIRSAFLPGEPGWKLLAADYSQIELRVLAHFSRDPALVQAFLDNDDVHTRVASEVFRVAPTEVTSEMRRRAKAVNFGVIYGQSPFGLAKSLEIGKDEATAFIEAYFSRFCGVAEFIEKVLEECRRTGYVTTILGRRRAVQGVRDPSQRADSRQTTLPERIAVNTVIQGSAADLIKQAMINVSRQLRREKLRTRMLLQIHDELVFETPTDELAASRELVCGQMTHAFQLSVPLRVDVKVGDNWADCEVWK